MSRVYFYVILAFAALSAVISTAYIWNNANRGDLQPKLLAAPPKAPYPAYISAIGVVEANSQNIYIGTPVNRLVERIEVQVGDQVTEGQILFCLESRDLEAELHANRVNYRNVIAKLKRLEAMPRPEDVAQSQAVYKGTLIELAQMQSQYDAIKGIENSGALSKEEVNRRKFALELAESKVKQAIAELEKTKAGAWEPDIEIARIDVKQAKAAVEKTEMDIERTIVRSPIDGTILQIRINKGEYPPVDSTRTPAMILGNTEPFHLRVNINQYDVTYFKTTDPASAFLEGDASTKYALEFVHLEPFLIDKQQTTNDIREKLDTRVLQVVYRFAENHLPLYVGQQMDVFIATEGRHQE